MTTRDQAYRQHLRQIYNSTKKWRGNFYLSIAFIAVVVIWASKPLAIQWSFQDGKFFFSLMARMLLGLAVIFFFVTVCKIAVPLDRSSLAVYFLNGFTIFTTTSIVYYGAQFIPSGWVSVIFALAPLVSGLGAAFWLGKPFGITKSFGALLGFAGIAMVFGHGVADQPKSAVIGIVAVLIGTIVYSLCIVWIKVLSVGIAPLAMTLGTLATSSPLFMIAWFCVDGEIPDDFSARTWFSIAYLGVVASALGYMLFFYLLARIDADKAALNTIIAPLLALWIGATFNNEKLDPQFLQGAGLVIGGIVVYQYRFIALSRVIWGKQYGAGKLEEKEATK